MKMKIKVNKWKVINELNSVDGWQINKRIKDKKLKRNVLNSIKKKIFSSLQKKKIFQQFFKKKKKKKKKKPKFMKFKV